MAHLPPPDIMWYCFFCVWLHPNCLLDPFFFLEMSIIDSHYVIRFGSQGFIYLSQVGFPITLRKNVTPNHGIIFWQWSLLMIIGLLTFWGPVFKGIKTDSGGGCCYNARGHVWRGSPVLRPLGHLRGALTSVCFGVGDSPPVYLLFHAIYWFRQPRVFHVII